MTNQPFLYDPQANVLRHKSTVAKPDPLSSSNYGFEKMLYETHIAALPAYTPVSGWVPEVGKEYQLGEDFEVMDTDKWWWAKCEKCGWEGSSEHLHTEKNMGEATDDAYCACPNCYSVNVEGRSKYCAPDMSGKFAAPLPFIEISAPIEQKQEAVPKCICHNEGRYMSCTIRCERVIAEEEEEQKQEDAVAAEIVNKVVVLKQERGQHPMFTLQDMIECWEAAKNMPDGDYWKKKYFKSKFKIDI